MSVGALWKCTPPIRDMIYAVERVDAVAAARQRARAVTLEDSRRAKLNLAAMGAEEKYQREVERYYVVNAERLVCVCVRGLSFNILFIYYV